MSKIKDLLLLTNEFELLLDNYSGQTDFSDYVTECLGLMDLSQEDTSKMIDYYSAVVSFDPHMEQNNKDYYKVILQQLRSSKV